MDNHFKEGSIRHSDIEKQPVREKRRREILPEIHVKVVFQIFKLNSS